MCIVGLMFLAMGFGALGYTIIGVPDSGQYQRPERGYVVSHPSPCHVGLSEHLGGEPKYTRATSWDREESDCPAYEISDQVYFDPAIKNMPVATTPDDEHGRDGSLKVLTALMGIFFIFGAFYIPIKQIKSEVRRLRKRKERELKHAQGSTAGQ